MAIFRGASYQPQRQRFMRLFFENPLFDCADTRPRDRVDPPQWHGKLITLYDHLKYKFIVSIEGNDVASNLKWAMSSNSLVLMPKPKFETWFMEGKLQGNVHYVEIKDDYSDAEDKIKYYAAHVDAAKIIIENAHRWCAQFQNQEREKIISLLVLRKYFDFTQ